VHCLSRLWHRKSLSQRRQFQRQLWRLQLCCIRLVWIT
ncbi:anaerobic c4-dicarboxylate membrane transporter family protein, partial [Vibrio parahaemolyticus 12310]